MKKKRARIRIYGIVQGVFFRYNALEKAKELQITGWVKNESDETVKIDAEGEEKNLQRFIDWCHNGPDQASVNKVEIEWDDYKNLFKNFKIK
ncbi:acylphosphatase [Patescibacteria group bacterium]|nr:acylphosphatase [Patescibacteria group bacterium]